MASLLKKKIKNNTYYYYVEQKRIDGKPRFVKQIYLGTAQQILQRIKAPAALLSEVTHCRFGLEAALFKIAQQLHLIEILNGYANHTTPHLDVGRYLLIAAINRCCDWRSKRGIRLWYEKSVLPELIEVPAKALSSQSFWSAMHQLDPQSIPKIEERLWEKLIAQFQVTPDILLYDTTNFFSYIDSKTPSELAQRGHNKAGKHTLRQLGVAMAVVRGLDMPFMHQVYSGSVTDGTLFSRAITELVKRVYQTLKTNPKLTLVYDKGNNSQANQDWLSEQESLAVIGTLSPSQYPDLMRVGLSRFHPLELANGKRVSYFATHKAVFGQKHPVVVTFNEELGKRQQKMFDDRLGKILSQASQVDWRRVQHREEKLKQILNHCLPMGLFRFDKQALTVNEVELKKYRKRFGKNIIFSTRSDLTAPELIEITRDRNDVETIFKDMNNEEVSPMRPVYHWTDQKMLVPAFICVLGLLLVRVLHYKLKKETYKLPVEMWLEELRDMRCMIAVTKEGKIQKLLSKFSSVQENLYHLLDLNEITEQLGIHLSV